MANKKEKRPVGRPRSAASKVTTIRLTPEQQAKLDAIAKNEGIKRTAVLQIAIARFLKKGI